MTRHSTIVKVNFSEYNFMYMVVRPDTEFRSYFTRLREAEQYCMKVGTYSVIEADGELKLTNLR